MLGAQYTNRSRNNRHTLELKLSIDEINVNLVKIV